MPHFSAQNYDSGSDNMPTNGDLDGAFQGDYVKRYVGSADEFQVSRWDCVVNWTFSSQHFKYCHRSTLTDDITYMASRQL